jgi:hypothetical protein
MREGTFPSRKDDFSHATFLEPGSDLGNRPLPASLGPPALPGPLELDADHARDDRARDRAPRLGRTPRVGACLDGPTLRDRDGRYHALPLRRRGPPGTHAALGRPRTSDRPGRACREFRDRARTGEHPGPCGRPPPAVLGVPPGCSLPQPGVGPLQPPARLPDGRWSGPPSPVERAARPSPSNRGCRLPGAVDRNRRRHLLPVQRDVSGPPPAGFRWADRGDGIWRLEPIMVHVGERHRSWN